MHMHTYLQGKRKALVRMGSKPMMVFNGDEFETNDDLALLKNLLLDYFRGDVLPKINLAGLDTVIVTTAANGKVYFRVYGIALKKSGNKFPRVEMEEVGPRMDLTLRRRKSAASELRKHAMKVPYAAKPKQQKNTRTGQMGAKVGKIFMESQNLTELALTKPKALKRRGRGSGEGEESSPSKKQRK